MGDGEREVGMGRLARIPAAAARRSRFEGSWMEAGRGGKVSQLMGDGEVGMEKARGEVTVCDDECAVSDVEETVQM